MYCFHKHILDIAAKASQRLNLMKALSGTSWGHNQETLLLTFKALVESVFSFATAVWFPNCKSYKIAKLQTLQNQAMRLNTGCHKATSVDHLHAETKLMPVNEHLSMLCSQYLASALRLSHPSHGVVRLPPGPRKNQHGCPMKGTLASKFTNSISHHLTGDGTVSEVSYKCIKDSINTEAVSTYIASASPNPVLERKPPDVHTSVTSLPRTHHNTLTQLRYRK